MIFANVAYAKIIVFFSIRNRVTLYCDSAEWLLFVYILLLIYPRVYTLLKNNIERKFISISMYTLEKKKKKKIGIIRIENIGLR